MIRKRFAFWLSIIAIVIASPLPAFGSILVNLQQVGSPVWVPVDFHLFSTTIGTPQSGFAEFFEKTEEILPPPNHLDHSQLGRGPGAVHSGYDQEFAESLARLGFVDRDTFSASEFSFPNGIILLWMTVPSAGAPTGSSPDGFPNGPIIPNSLFPINIDYTLLRNGDFLSSFVFPEPPLDEADPPFDVEGHSHFPFFIAEAASFVPGTDPPGNYEILLMMRDVENNGWNIQIGFQVVPEPGSLALLGTGLAALLGVCLALAGKTS